MNLKHLLAICLAFACGAPEDFEETDELGTAEQAVFAYTVAACGDSVPEYGVNGNSATWTHDRCNRNNAGHGCYFPHYKHGFQTVLDTGWTSLQRAGLQPIGQGVASQFSSALGAWSHGPIPQNFTFHEDGFHPQFSPTDGRQFVAVNKVSFGLPPIPGTTSSIATGELVHMYCATGQAVTLSESTPYPATFKICKKWIAEYDYDRAVAWATAAGKVNNLSQLHTAVFRHIEGTGVGLGTYTGSVANFMNRTFYVDLAAGSAFGGSASGSEQSWANNYFCPLGDPTTTTQLQCLTE